MRRRHSNDDLFLHGWAKFFHNLIMFILYPLRRPLNFLLLMILLCGIALLPAYFLDLDVKELPEWYKEQKNEIWQKVSNKAQLMYFAYSEDDAPVVRRRKSKTVSAARPKNEIVAKSAQPTEQKQPEARPEPKRYVGDEIDIKYQKDMEKYQNESVRKTGRKNPLYGTQSRFRLNYTPEIMEVYGKAEVYNANEIMVGNVYMFLFGIYTDAKSSNYEYAKKFLQENIENQNVRCEILAYTEQNIATAKCYLGARCINDMLTDAGLAKKVF